MPLTILHAAVGAGAGAAFYAADCQSNDRKIDGEILRQVILLGGIAGALPDLLEPPTHRRHRSFFHSFATLGAATFLLFSIDGMSELDEDEKSKVKSLIISYLSHLLLDSGTPMGLPFLLQFKYLVTI